MFNFFKKTFQNIFISSSEKKKLEIGDGKVDYILSRSLYANVPTSDGSSCAFTMGNYCVKPYIDTLSGYISTPHIVSVDERFNTDIDAFLAKNEATLTQIYRQAMIDGLVFVWFKIEKKSNGAPAPVLKIVSREDVYMEDCVKARNGNFEKVVILQKINWNLPKVSADDVDNEKEVSTLRIELTPYFETYEIVEGKVPPSFSPKKETWNTSLPFVPFFSFYNNRLNFLSDGLPEVATVLPFIRKYNRVFEQLDKHLHNILDPKLKLRLKSASSFLKNSLGVREKDFERIEKGEYKPDVTQFKVAILQDRDEDVEFVNQGDSVKSALDVLNLLHWIIVELTMPEYLYGTALGTTNASVKEQSPVWIKKIEGRRAEYSDFYYWLSECFYAYSFLANGKAVYNDVISAYNSLKIEWEEIETKDDVALMNAIKAFSDAISQLRDEGFISGESAFNVIKTYIPTTNEWSLEHQKAIEEIKELASLKMQSSENMFA